MAEAPRGDLPDGPPGRTALVCGAGVAGQSMARALLARGWRVLLADRADSPAVALLVAAGAQHVGEPQEVPAGVWVVATSPGWSPKHPLLQAAAATGLEVIGEVELAWRLRSELPAPWLAVTGTNGKTTTVHMLESILRAAGLRALAVGNVGVPVVDAVVADEPYDVLAVELSSFQLHWSATVAPAAAALLNIAPDHLDWHASMAAYVRAKASIWRGPVAIGNVDDPAVAEQLARSVSERRVGFTLAVPAPGQLGVRDGVLVDRAFAGGDGVPLLPAAEVRPAGAHNVANALAAAALARAHGVDAQAVAAGLRAFVPDRHRNEFVATRAGVGFVDDSKATNPHAARASLVAYRPVVWIAGGQLKDAPVDELVHEVAERLAGVVLLGRDRARIAAALQRHAPDVPVIDVARTDDGAMIDVVAAAARLARAGDTVLLAPAAASYDMFNSYAQRGTAFQDAVRALGS